LRESPPLLVFSKTYTTGIGFALNISNNNISNILTYFVRSGYVNPSNSAGTFRDAGSGGFWWSSRGASTRYDGVTTPSAYRLHFGVTGVSTSNGPHNRYIAFPLRCLSTVLGMGGEM